MFVKEYLENGIPVVMESLKNVRSVAVGVWVKVGSRYETPAMNGISHFLEQKVLSISPSCLTRE